MAAGALALALWLTLGTAPPARAYSISPAPPSASRVEAGAQQAPPAAQLSGFRCVRAAEAPERILSITAVMRHLPGTVRLAVRFDLLERRRDSSAFTTLRAPGLLSWISPTEPVTLGERPGDVWYVRKPVAGLAAGAAYRFVVGFHWIGARGRIIARSTRVSRVCQEPSPAQAFSQALSRS
jgi:hypothetical protein